MDDLVSLVHIEVSGLGILLPHLLVPPLEMNAENPGADDDTGREPNAGHHGHHVTRLVGLGPEVRSVDAGQVAKGVGHGNGNGSLLGSLADNTSSPTKDDVVDAWKSQQRREVAIAGVYTDRMLLQRRA